nr:DUF3783 domain-containing protein [Mycobacterium uberis]
MVTALAAAKQTGCVPVKVKAVLDPTNRHENVVKLLQFCLDQSDAVTAHQADDGMP